MGFWADRRARKAHERTRCPECGVPLVRDDLPKHRGHEHRGHEQGVTAVWHPFPKLVCHDGPILRCRECGGLAMPADDWQHMNEAKSYPEGLALD